jgi:hypothetical protein
MRCADATSDVLRYTDYWYQTFGQLPENHTKIWTQKKGQPEGWPDGVVCLQQIVD